ncbi:MAG: O-antigen ligase family protein, partial [Planctomycetota bacterium]
MIERILRYCDRAVESGWLIAMASIPLFFNPYSARIFESDKTYILISIALMMVLFTIPKAAALWKDKTPNIALIYLVGIFWAVYLVSSVLSITPAISLGGFYLREEGFITLSAYLIIFILIVKYLRGDRQVERIITTAILTGFVVALYGIFQRFGVDTVAWASSTATRVTTTFGNPIFAGAFLIMVIPLVLCRLIAQIRLRCFSQTAAYGLILIIQTWCVLATQSRGPFIGLVAGIFFFAVLYAILNGHKKLIISTVAVVILAGVFLLLLNIEGSPLSALKPRLGRLGEITEAQTGSGKVRILIWEGAVSILKAEPARIFFGHGLETMFPLYHKHIPGSFARYEGSFAVPDHSHN